MDWTIRSEASNKDERSETRRRWAIEKSLKIESSHIGNNDEAEVAYGA